MSNSRPVAPMAVVGTTLLLCFVFFVVDHRLTISLTLGDPDVIQAQVAAISTGSSQRPIAFLILGISSVLLLMRQRRPSFALQGSPLLLLVLYLGWAWFSFFWADDPRLVLKRVVAFSLLLLAACAVSMTFPESAFASILFGVTGVYLVFGVVAETVLGTFRPLAEEYRFMGTTHPEGQGLNCGMLALSSLSLSDRKTGYTRVFLRLTAVVAFTFLVFTRSRGPFAAVLVAILAYYSLLHPRRGGVKVALLAVLIVSLLVMTLGATGLTSLLLMGRQEDVTTLTGRIPLWVECMNYVRERPWTGHGFNAFWTESRLLDFSESQGWVNYSAHSIYVDTALGVGVVGLTVFAAILLSAVKYGVKSAKTGPDRMQPFFVGLLLLMGIDGLLSSIVIEGGFDTFALFTGVLYCCFSKSIQGRDQRLTRANA